MNISKPTITQNQKEIIRITLRVTLIVLIFLVFFYLPADKKIARLKKELTYAQQQIRSIELLLTGAQSQEEVVRLLKQKQEYLMSKFPQQEEASLRFIAETAAKMQVEVILVQPQTRREFLDRSGKPSSVDNRQVRYLPVTLELVCFYKDLVKYLSQLDARSPAFLSVENLSIKKDNPPTGKIHASVEINLYLLD